MRVALQTGRAAARDAVNTGVAFMGHLGFKAGPRHQETMQRAGAVYGQGSAKAVAAGRIVHDGVLVVVVPAHVNAVVQHLGLELRFPPVNHRRLGEVQVGTDTVPELLDDGLAGACIVYEALLGFDPGVGRMIVEQAGFDVGHQVHAGLLELGIQCFRVWKLALVPGEDVAALALGGVARAVVKGRDGYIFLRDAVNKAVELGLRICCVGQTHGRLCITQRPARR